MFTSMCILTSLVAQSLGLVIGCACDIQSAVYLGPITTIPILLFSGNFTYLCVKLIVTNLNSNNDPLCQLTVPAGSDFRFILKFWEDGQTDNRCKFSDHYYMWSASWIKKKEEEEEMHF